jgi:hypothetical protein
MLRLLLLPRLEAGCCAKLLEAVRSGRWDYIVLTAGAADAHCLRLLSREAGSSRRVLGVPSNSDDHHIARLIAEISASVLEGHVVYLGEGFYAAGVGGREPLANIASIRREAAEYGVERLILVSFYPPYGSCDGGLLPGVHHGLWEVAELIEDMSPVLVVSTCRCPGSYTVTLEGGGKPTMVCLPAESCCYSLVEVGGGVERLALVNCASTPWRAVVEEVERA